MGAGDRIPSDLEQLASRIGGRYTRTAMICGLLAAALIFVQLSDVNGLVVLITNWPLQSFVCIVGGPFVGHVLGARAGRLILLKNWNAFWTSLFTGMISVLFITVVFASFAFLDEGLGGGGPIMDAFHDYMLKPLFWTLIFPFPIIVAVAGVMAVFFVRTRKKEFLV